MFQVSGTFVATVTFEGSIDGNWLAIHAHNMTTNVLATTATAAGLYRAHVGVRGLTAVRSRVSDYTSGAVTVQARGR